MAMMKRYLGIKSSPFLLIGRNGSQDESTPLIPKVRITICHCFFPELCSNCILVYSKAGSRESDTGEFDIVSKEYMESGTNGGRNHSHTVFSRIQRYYSYSWMDYFLKYFLFLCTLLFTVLGLLVLGLGMWGLISKESFAKEKVGSIGTDPMLLLVTLGLLLTMLCLSGCVGALRENSCLLKLFSAAVLVLVSAQVLAAILLYSLQDQLGGYLRSGILTAMARYQDDLDLRFITDEIQTNLQCCGADNYRDWEVNM